jgi:uncharacterized protein (DUF1800 family)
MNPTLRALNGFGLGARIGEGQHLRDPRGWLRAQLDGGAPVLAPPAEGTADRIADALGAFRTGRQASRMARQQARRELVGIAAAEGRAALSQRVLSDRPFVERLVAFWSNHLCISAAGKVLVAPLAGRYEREAVRPHVLGRFEDMVLASARHPAMLVYLDNVRSTRRGLNENYARELLELHTLGVDGGYTQRDVQELARVLTGWTVTGTRFTFRPRLHEPGAKTILGVTYQEAGAVEGERAIRTLCAHPSTARFVAGKLVKHFVSDDPPTSAVDRIARVFRESGGDLRVVSAALVDLPEAWNDTARKFRTPQDWLVAVLRAFRAETVNEQLMPVLRQLRHPLWSPQAPKGFGDTAQEWADPDSLLNRAELSRTIARRMPPVDPRGLLDVVDAGADDPLRQLLDDRTIPAGERLALALAGPAFQWR